MTEIGNYLASKRRALRLTQPEVSERLAQYGIDRTPSTVAGWETGKQIPPVEVLPALAKVLEEPSVVRLYALAGLFADVPAARILALMNDLPAEDVQTLEAMVAAFVQAKKNR